MAVLGIVATMPYIALQLIGMEAVFEVMGLPKGWPLTLAFVVLALYTFNPGCAGRRWCRSSRTRWCCGRCSR